MRRERKRREREGRGSANRRAREDANMKKESEERNLGSMAQT